MSDSVSRKRRKKLEKELARATAAPPKPPVRVPDIIDQLMTLTVPAPNRGVRPQPVSIKPD
jgi:hypothetical protein